MPVGITMRNSFNSALVQFRNAVKLVVYHHHYAICEFQFVITGKTFQVSVTLVRVKQTTIIYLNLLLCISRDYCSVNLNIWIWYVYSFKVTGRPNNHRMTSVIQLSAKINLQGRSGNAVEIEQFDRVIPILRNIAAHYTESQQITIQSDLKIVQTFSCAAH